MARNARRQAWTSSFSWLEGVSHTPRSLSSSRSTSSGSPQVSQSGEPQTSPMLLSRHNSPQRRERRDSGDSQTETTKRSKERLGKTPSVSGRKTSFSTNDRAAAAPLYAWSASNAPSDKPSIAEELVALVRPQQAHPNSAATKRRELLRGNQASGHRSDRLHSHEHPNQHLDDEQRNESNTFQLSSTAAICDDRTHLSASSSATSVLFGALESLLGGSSLKVAASQGNIAVLRKGIHQLGVTKITSNHKHPEPLLHRSDWTSALVSACENGQVASVKFLLRYIDVNAKVAGGETPMHQASYHGYSEIVELLIGAGGNVDSTNEMGETPLMYAARKGQLQTVCVLLCGGADSAKVDRFGDSALDQSTTASIARMLISMANNSGGGTTRKQGNWMVLKFKLLNQIASFLSHEDNTILAAVCTSWRNFTLDHLNDDKDSTDTSTGQFKLLLH